MSGENILLFVSFLLFFRRGFLSLLFLVTGIMLPITSVFAALSVQTADTIAGYSTTLKTSVASPQEEVVFRVEKPDGGVITFTEMADERGVARAEFLGFHTKKAGEYFASAALSSENFQNAPRTSFTVFADSVSSIHSEVSVLRDAAPANGKDEAKIRVRLKDRYGNPITNHLVELISSRSTDSITAYVDGISDRFGEVFFFIRSRESGVSYFSVLDRKTGVTLKSRAQVVFFAEEKKAMGAGGLSANIFGTGNGNGSSDTFGSIDHFEISFPETVTVGSDTNFLRITAMDKEGRVSKNYTGTILISVPDDDTAVLPNDGIYTFTDKDEGMRAFDLALIFHQSGEQKIVVNDFYNGEISPFLKGEKSVTVLDKCSGKSCGVSGGTKGRLELKSPVDGSEFGTSTVSVSGKANPNSDLVLFLDNREIGRLGSDSDGVFLDEVTDIADGDHALFLREAEGLEEKTKTAHFSVDTTPPTLDEIGLYPANGVDVGGSYTITVLSEAGLDSVIARVAGSVEPLLEDEIQKGKYMATLVAPDTPGDFGISIALTDRLKNTANISNAATLKVRSSVTQLPAPSGLTADAGFTSVTLSWEPLLEDGVAEYRVVGGTNELFLKAAKNVDGRLSTTKIEDLKSGRQYFFAVSAVSEEGIVGQQSRVVTATTLSESKKPKPIPKPEPEPTPIPHSILTASRDGRVLLKWTKNKKSAVLFDIRFGVYPTQLTERFSIDARNTQVAVPDLINGVRYYFTVVPLDKNGIPTGEEYPVVDEIPAFSGVHPAPTIAPILENILKTDPVGAGSVLVFLLALSFASGLFLIRRALLFFP